MRNRTAPVLVLALALALAPLAPISVGFQADDTPATPTRSGPDPIESLEDRLVGVGDGDAVPADPVEREVYVVIRMKRGVAPDHPQFDLRNVYDREGAHIAGGYIPLMAVRDLSKDQQVEAVRIERSRLRSDRSFSARPDANVAAGVSAIGADRLQLAGVTGRNVTVGVVDAGFRVSDPEIAGRVGAYRSFDAEGSDWVHGTAVASVVADTAPGANLHLAAVGGSTTPGEYRDAVAWLRESGADVIVDAGSYFGQPGDGSGEIASVAAAASRDVVFVAAAGNYAGRHWRGHYAPARGATRVEFAPGETANYLEGGAPFGGTVSATLRWDDWNGTDGNRSDYDLLLYRHQPGTDAVVDRGTAADDEPVEHLAARVPRGRYYLAVRASNATDGDTLDLFASRGLTHRSPGTSLTAPGTAPGVLTVGALDGNGSVAAFSSRGPVAGTDRLGVDLVAADDVALPGTSPGAGSSYAAPYVAGTAALLVGDNPSFAPRDVRSVLRTSATDVGRPGPDPVSGYGRLDAAAAAEFAVEYEQYVDINGSRTARDGRP
ncbi:MAG: S8 family serine peptidase [Haloarculaceae archaeon]